MKVSTEVYTYAIVFMDGSTMEITERAYNAIVELSLKPNTKMVKLKGQLVSLSSISKILTNEEYYEQYPDKRPAPKVPHISELQEVSWEDISKGNFPNYTEERKGNALKFLMKGLQRFVDQSEKDGKKSPKAISLLKQMQLRQQSYVAQTKSS